MTAAATTPTTAALWQTLCADLSAFIRRRVPDASIADDLLQETFVRIHSGLEALQDDTRVVAWAYRIARNVVTDHFRRRAPELPLGERLDIPGEAAEPDSSDTRLVGGWLLSMIPELPPTYREAVRLAEVEGLPQAEIAERLGLSLSGAKSRVQRGRAHLRNILRRCCDVEFDRRGNVVDWRCRAGNCEE